MTVEPPDPADGRSGPILIYMQVADDIERKIKAGELKPGARLPNERELAAEYGVARLTGARAVRELRDRGLVVTVIGKGTFVVGDEQQPWGMRPARAIEELEKLKEESTTPAVTAGGEVFTSWRARVKSVLTKALGEGHHLVESFDGVEYGLMIFYAGTPKSDWDQARLRGIRRACGLIDAAIYELGLQGGDEPIDEHAYDPELWAYVKTLVEDDEWAKVASQTAIFVESRVRTWCGNPRDKSGNNLVGKALYADVFADASDYRLGRQASEHEGWRFLGMGFAQALSNVDRHRIQNRDDTKRYALGVLGLGSLLLTQLRFEHKDILKTDK